jgi:hypothetical protein
MAKNSIRRQIGNVTPKGDRITIGHVSGNGGAERNAKAKGCFGFNDPYARHSKTYWERHKR